MRRGVWTIDGKGRMRDECSNWNIMVAEAKRRVDYWHATDPETRKFPDPLPYGLVEGTLEFRMGEDATASDSLRVVAENVAQEIESVVNDRDLDITDD